MQQSELFAPGPRAVAPDQFASCRANPDDDIDIRLVRPVQIYLEIRRLDVAPGPSLERVWLAFFAAANPIVLAAVRADRKARADIDDRCQEAWR
jgi:hypothetical protein